MRGTLFFRIIVAVAVAAALGGVLVAVAGADDAGRLPDITAPELLARMGDASRAPAAVSGDVSWTNELFGVLPFVPDHAAEPASSPLMASGSGRVWAQDGKVRFESQGQGGDRVVVADARAGTVWTYSFADDTARLYERRGAAGGATVGAPQAAPPPAPPGPEGVSRALRAAARFMTVEVTGQTAVAGRAAYVLTMTPAAADTALGSVEAAVDGRTFVPLRVEVTAKGAHAPTLSFRFDRVTFEPVDDAVFAFTPPAGAVVERRTLDALDAGHGGDKGAALRTGSEGVGPGAPDRVSDAERSARTEQMKELARAALLTRAQAAELVDFPLAWARGSTAREFRWAYVFRDGVPVDALGSPVFGPAGLPGVPDGAGEGAGGDAAGGSPPVPGPAAVLLYGEGFGTIVLAQMDATVEVREQLRQLPDVVGSIDLGGTPAKAVVTPLGSVIVWERDGVTLLAGGMVTRDDLVGFAQSVR